VLLGKITSSSVRAPLPALFNTVVIDHRSDLDDLIGHYSQKIMASLTKFPGFTRIGSFRSQSILIATIDEEIFQKNNLSIKNTKSPVKTFSEMIEWELQSSKNPSTPTHEEDDSSITGVARSIRHRVKLLARQTAIKAGLKQAS
jgi:hypothetical protein